MLSTSRRLASTFAISALVTVAVTGCTSKSSGTGTDSTSTGTSAAASSDAGSGTTTGRLTVAAILGPLDDPFFPPMHQGLVDAAEGLDVDLKYLSAAEDDSFVTSYAKLIEQATAMKPDAILVGDYVPDTFDPLLKKAIAAGIPVVVVQSGQANWEALGAIGYVGQDVNQLGEPAAEAYIKAGKKNVLCVNKGAGNPYLEAICTSLSKAMAAKGGKATMYAVPISDASNPTTLSRNIGAQLQSHSEYDAVFTQGAGDAVAAASAIKQLGKSESIALGTLALNTAVLQSIQDKELTFALDEQPYLDGYYSMVMAAHYVRYQLLPAYPTYLGYRTIDADNVASVLATHKANPGIRGSS